MKKLQNNEERETGMVGCVNKKERDKLNSRLSKQE